LFSRRRYLDRRRRYSKELFLSLLQELEEAGMEDISVVLPHNYETVDPRNSVVSIKDFLDRERNYAAIILIARSKERNELLKVLFVNSSAKALFVDDTFPSAASEPPALYFQSPDPARTYALFEYFFDLLNQDPIRRFVLFSIVQIIASLFILLEAFSLLGKKGFLISKQFRLPIYLDLIALLFSILFAYRFFSQPSGLWIKPKRETKLFSFLKMAIRGELRDNPAVQLLITILGGIIVAILAKLFGIL
jgi:hypothetical protein